MRLNNIVEKIKTGYNKIVSDDAKLGYATMAAVGTLVIGGMIFDNLNPKGSDFSNISDTSMIEQIAKEDSVYEATKDKERNMFIADLQKSEKFYKTFDQKFYESGAPKENSNGKIIFGYMPLPGESKQDIVEKFNELSDKFEISSNDIKTPYGMKTDNNYISKRAAQEKYVAITVEK